MGGGWGVMWGGEGVVQSEKKKKKETKSTQAENLYLESRRHEEELPAAFECSAEHRTHQHLCADQEQEVLSWFSYAIG